MNRLDRKLTFNIGLVSVSLFFIQTAIYLTICFIWNIRPMHLIYFLPGSGLFHLIIFSVLLGARNMLILLPERKQLDHVNLTNWISLLRMSSMPTLLTLILKSRTYPITKLLLIFTAAVFLTDLIDGKLSRKLHQTTLLGQGLDSASDYAVLSVVSISFYVFKMIPSWLFWLIAARMLIVIIGTLVMRLLRGQFLPDLSYMGKVSVFAVMTVYGFEILETTNLPIVSAAPFITAVEILGAVLVGISIIDKLILYTKKIRGEKQKKAGS